MAKEREANEQAKLNKLFQALDEAKLGTKEQKQAFLDKYLPGKTQEEIIKMGEDYNGPHTAKAFENLNAVIPQAPVVTQAEKAQIQKAEKNPLGSGLEAIYEKDKENKEKAAAPKAPGFLERVKSSIEAAGKNIQAAAQRATAKIDQRVAAAAEKREARKEIKQAVKSWQDKPSLLERIKSAATNAKTKIAGIASDAITKLQAIGKKAENREIEMDEMKVSAPDASTFRKVTENNNAAQLAAQAVTNPHQGVDAEEVVRQKAAATEDQFDDPENVVPDNAEEVSLIDEVYAEIQRCDGEITGVVDQFTGSAKELLAEAEAEEALEIENAITKINDAPPPLKANPTVQEQADSFLDELDQALANIDGPTTPKGSTAAAPTAESNKTAEPDAPRSSGPGSKG